MSRRCDYHSAIAIHIVRSLSRSIGALTADLPLTFVPLHTILSMPFISPKHSTDSESAVSKMLNSLHGQPGSYDKKSMYRFGKTLGAGTYGIVREADVEGKKVAVKIILKKNVKNNEKMVYDELEMLQKLHHPHIVRFVDWFESRVCQAMGPDNAPLTGSRTSST